MNKISQTAVSAILLLILVVVGYYLHQSKSKSMDINQIQNTQISATAISSRDLTKKEQYLEKNDLIYQLLSARVVGDMKTAVQKSDPTLPENQALKEKISLLPKEKQDEIQKQATMIMQNSLVSYMVKTQYVDSLENANGLKGAMTVLSGLLEFAKKDPAEISKQYDLRVLPIGNNEYVVEFWIGSSAETPTGLYATAITAITAIVKGEGLGFEKYDKDQAVWYTIDENKNVVFHSPTQELEDFIKTL